MHCNMTRPKSLFVPTTVAGWTIIGQLLVSHPSHAQPRPVILAQAPVPAASIFSEWSTDDVRQGASPRAAERPRLNTTPAAPAKEPPKDIRSGSTPSRNTPGVIRLPWQAAPSAISTQTEPVADQQPNSAAAPAASAPARKPLITLRPFSDGDLRQGSSRR